MRRVAEGRVVGHLAQAEGASQLAPLAEERHHATVVEAQHLLDGEEGEELGLGEVVARVRARVAG